MLATLLIERYYLFQMQIEPQKLCTMPGNSAVSKRKSFSTRTSQECMPATGSVRGSGAIE